MEHGLHQLRLKLAKRFKFVQVLDFLLVGLGVRASFGGYISGRRVIRSTQHAFPVDRRLDALNDLVCINVFLFHDLLLDLLGKETLEQVGLHLEVLVEFLQVLYVVVDQLGLLLLLGQPDLDVLSVHAGLLQHLEV